MPKKYFLVAGVGLLLSAVAAQAGPITTPPPTLSAVGDVRAVFVYANAGDVSVLNEIKPKSVSQIFCNHTTVGCTAASSGDQMDLGIQSGPMEFSLLDENSGTTFFNDAADSDGNYHALVTSNFADFNVGAIPLGADSVITSLMGMGNNITYVGFEDRTAAQGGDFDYNDLIFAFANTVAGPTSTIPEPLTLSMFGAGIAGAAWLRRRRKVT